MRRIRFEHVAFVGILVAAPRAHSQSQAGQEKFGLHKWTYIDDNNKWISVAGEIRSIEYNTKAFDLRGTLHEALETAFSGGPINLGGVRDLFTDDDLNLWVKTDLQAPLFNRSHTLVPHCSSEAFGGSFNRPGQMEMEIKHIPGLLTRYLESGMRIKARGYWVQDEGHCHKPELHPVNVILAALGDLDTATFLVYYHGLDRSGRFDRGTDDPQERTTAIDFLAKRDTVWPIQGPTLGQRAVPFIIEKSILDVFSSVSSWSVVLPTPGAARMEYTTTVRPGPVPLLGGVNIWDGFYLATFKRGGGSRMGFKDSVSARLQRDSVTGYNAVDIHIAAELLPSAMSRAIEGSRWWLSDGSESTPIVTAPHRMEYLVRYSPIMNLRQKSWTLSVRGRSQAYNDEPRPYYAALSSGSNSQQWAAAQAAMMLVNFGVDVPVPAGAFGTRETAFVERDYVITPSQITLTTGNVCADTVIVDAGFTPVIQGVSLQGGISGIRWGVRSWGKLVSGVVGGYYPAGADVVSEPMIHGWVDPNNQGRIFVAMDPALYAPVTVLAEGSTDIGENLKEKLEVRTLSSCGPIGEPNIHIAQLLEDLLRGELVLQKLNGTLPRPGTPTVVTLGRLPDLDLLLPKLDSTTASMVVIHRRFLEDLSITADQFVLLQKLAGIGRDGRWSQRPDPERLRTLSGLSNVRQLMRSAPRPAAVDRIEKPR